MAALLQDGRTDGRLSAKGRGVGDRGDTPLARRVPAAGSRMPPPIFTGLRRGKTYKRAAPNQQPNWERTSSNWSPCCSPTDPLPLHPAGSWGPRTCPRAAAACRAVPLWLRMWISKELALGQLFLHWGKGQTRSLGYVSLGFSSRAGEPALCRLAQ